MKQSLFVFIFSLLLFSCETNNDLTTWLNDESFFDSQNLFSNERFPNLVISNKGTLIATWGSSKVIAKRSTNGGKSWGDEIIIAKPGFHGGGTLVDEVTGNIFVFVEEGHPISPIQIYVSSDDGQSWKKHDTTISPDEKGHLPSMHMNEHGVTLKKGKYSGRLIRPSRYYGENNSKEQYSNHYSNAIYSDDRGISWKTSSQFPAFGTGEAALEELSNGMIYYNSRRHYSNDGLNPKMRHVAFSYDGGESWEDLSVSSVLPDGAQFRDYGLMGGLTRVPLKDLDILLFSNIISSKKENARTNGYVWVSFDGGKSWPLKKSVDKGNFAYSSMIAGRPGTISEGMIFLLYESESGAKLARFNLQWLLDGVDISTYLKL